MNLSHIDKPKKFPSNSEEFDKNLSDRVREHDLYDSESKMEVSESKKEFIE